MSKLRALDGVTAGGILQSWTNRRELMTRLAEDTRQAESWTATERALLEACKADLQVATHNQLAEALEIDDPVERYGALHALFLFLGQAREAAQYARLESELVERREQRAHELRVAQLEHVEDVPAAITEALESLPPADLVALANEVNGLVNTLGG